MVGGAAANEEAQETEVLDIAQSSNGRMPLSERGHGGSNPSRAANLEVWESGLIHLPRKQEGRKAPQVRILPLPPIGVFMTAYLTRRIEELGYEVKVEKDDYVDFSRTFVSAKKNGKKYGLAIDVNKCPVIGPLLYWLWLVHALKATLKTVRNVERKNL